MNEWRQTIAASLTPDKLTEAALEDRISGLSQWLEENGPACLREQAHLDEGTRERVYWHYGYLIALRDVLALMRRQKARVG